MTIFFVGTIAELIKLFPVMRRMEEEGVPYQLVASGQNDLMKSELMGHLRTQVSVWLHQGPIKQSAGGLFLWFLKTLFRGYFRLRKAIPRESRGSGCMVLHGDTVSTLMGALIGKLLGFRLAHVEAGLRSFNFLSPFPEEICRCVVSYMVDIHLCPNEWAVGNLKKHQGLKINTGGNTLIDSLKHSQTLPVQSPLLERLEGSRYFVFVIHRQENIYDEALVRDLVRQIAEKTRSGIRCVFILHAPTQTALESFGIMKELESMSQVILSPRLRYLEFMRLLAKAEFLVTDGGSNQEECSYLGLPCLILRKATERTEGLGQNVLLSHCDPAIISGFLSDPQRYARPPQALDTSPSSVAVSQLRECGKGARA